MDDIRVAPSFQVVGDGGIEMPMSAGPQDLMVDAAEGGQSTPSGQTVTLEHRLLAIEHQLGLLPASDLNFEQRLQNVGEILKVASEPTLMGGAIANSVGIAPAPRVGATLKTASPAWGVQYHDNLSPNCPASDFPRVGAALIEIRDALRGLEHAQSEMQALKFTSAQSAQLFLVPRPAHTFTPHITNYACLGAAGYFDAIPYLSL
ncbi:hypothetical protein C8F04DRAFT_1186410 [Mycena alexandri]|uniref:Uncharacterized protein n=1 Tax=Mycena alexandri TaxID=1745969 RepID=A0AAD6WX69_9AGAR|nr:hypothetical protein C8F04DRAFT_1186410 [Mycena alexandri]